jgi:hypothetical protein
MYIFKVKLKKLIVMKKRSTYLILMIVAAFILALPATQAQAPLNPVAKDSWILNIGIGPATQPFGNGYGLGIGGKLAFEKGMWKVGPGVITLGGDFGLSFSWRNWDYVTFKLKERWGNLFLGARGAYHYGFGVKGLDVYGGVPLGIGFDRYTHSGYTAGYGDLSWETVSGYKHTPVFPYLGVFIGGSYFFNNTIGINGELGYNVTYANIGLVFKLN